MNQCTFTNPETGNRCTMGHFHCGPHLVGDPYHPSEKWVVPCFSPPCEFMRNSDGNGKEWEECPSCGKTRPVTEHAEPLPSVKKTKRFIYFRGKGIRCLTVFLSLHKAVELQVGRFTPAPYWFDISLSCSRCCDHSGPEFEIGVWGFHFIINMYDDRHWDHEKKKWEEHEH